MVAVDGRPMEILDQASNSFEAQKSRIQQMICYSVKCFLLISDCLKSRYLDTVFASLQLFAAVVRARGLMPRLRLWIPGEASGWTPRSQLRLQLDL